MKKLYLLTLFLFGYLYLHAQNVEQIDALLDSCNENLYSATDKALRQGHQALHDSKKIGYLHGVNDGLHKIGIVYDMTGEYDSSLFYFDVMYELGKRTNDSSIMASAINSRGLVLWNVGKPEQSLPLFYSAYQMFEALDDPLGKGKSMNNISIILSDLGRFNEAIKAAKIAIENFRLAGAIERIGAPLTNIGLYYKDLGVLDSAALFINRSIEFKLQIKDYYGLGIAYNALGGLALSKKEYEQVIEHHKKAVHYKEIVGDKYGIVEAYYNMAKAYRELGMYEKAHEILQKTQSDAEELGSNRMLYKVYDELYRYHQHKGEYEPALDYYVKSRHVKDSVTSNELHQSMEDLRTKYETEAKERENLLLKEQNRVQDLEVAESRQRENIKTISLVFSIVFLILFIISATLIYTRYKQKQEIRLTKEVQQAEEKERGRIARDLHDNVGAHLAFIIQRLDNSTSQEKHQLSDAAGNALSTLRETVWALNKNNISVEDFSDRLKTFVRTLQQGFPTVEVDFKEQINVNHKLSPGTALNLYRLCQEAVSNAFRHSKGTLLNIEINSNEQTQIRVAITDNGTGFDPVNDAKKDHYGLENMKFRANEAGAEYNLHSKSGMGTKISIVKTN